MQAQPFVWYNIYGYHTKCTKAGSDSTTAPHRKGHRLREIKPEMVCLKEGFKSKIHKNPTKGSSCYGFTTAEYHMQLFRAPSTQQGSVK